MFERIASVAVLLCLAAVPSFAVEENASPPSGHNALVACVDSYNFPASMKDAEPPGYDVEIVRAIGKLVGSPVEYVWTDTGTRGGLGRALRNSILQKKCNLFIGLGVSKDTSSEMKEKHLVFTRPYMSEGFVLVEKKNEPGKTKLSDFKDAKIGVAMSTPADAYLIDNGYNRSIFFRDRMILKALDSGEIEVGLIWSPALAYTRKDFAKSNIQVLDNYVPEASLRWNVAIAVPQADPELKQLLDKAIEELLKNGEIKRIVETYGVPFYPPTS